MIEAEYLASEDPKAMLGHLKSKGVCDDRRLMIFSANCYAARYGSPLPKNSPWHSWIAGKPSKEFKTPPDQEAASWILNHPYLDAQFAHLIREIWGNVFREVIGPVDAFSNLTEEIRPLVFWRSWLTPDVLTLAQIIRQGDHEAYEPLWDALEDAGCDNEEIRQHCAGRERCPTCLGEKYVIDGDAAMAIINEASEIQKHYVADMIRSGLIARKICRNCKVTGWIPLRCQHVVGCWCIQLILGDE